MTRKTILDNPAFVSWARQEFLLSRKELAALPAEDLDDCVEQWHESRAEEISVIEFFSR